MWSYQEHFRHNLEYRADQSFQGIGLPLDPLATLVGFATSDELHHQICVEPEDGPFKPDHFSGVLEEAHQLFATRDDRRMIVTGEGQQARFESASLDRVRRLALQAAFDATGLQPDRAFFVGGSQIVGGYRTFPVISVLTTPWNAVPQLPAYDETVVRVGNSLPDELMRRLLSSASLSLAIGEGPAELLSIGRNPAHELIGVAASLFTDGIPTRLGGVPSELMEHLTSIANTPYEGRPAIGRIAFAREPQTTRMIFVLQSPVRLSRTRSARKLLEMAGREQVVLSDGSHVLGLAARSDDEHFEATFDGRGSWSLSFGNIDLMTVSRGRAHLPTPPLERDLFEDAFERLFGTEHADREAVWDLALVAARQSHGTTLVIHRGAHLEAVRLGGQAVSIAPMQLTPPALDAASSIDGAVLIAPDGLCHAIGVILDGAAGEGGDPGRGARFNSAVRYVKQHVSDCLIVVVSEDGSIEMIPTPHRRVARKLVARRVEEVTAASKGDADFERFHRLERAALELAFYLSQDQCDELNTARDRVEEVRMARSGLRMGVPRVAPDPDMNDSFFLDDGAS